MRFKLIITAQRGNSIPINYQYPLSAAIYKILATGDAQYAEWLHQEGYAADSYNFKLFSYSRLRGTQGIENNALAVSSEPLELILSFWPHPAMEKFIRGLFANSEIYIGNQATGTLFTVKEIGLLPSPTFTDEMTFQTLSPIHVRYTNPRNGKIEYLHPDHREFERVFADNLRHKLEAWHEHTGTTAPDTRFTALEVLSEPRSRLITIKERSLHETRIKAYDFRFRIKASPLLLEAGYYSGFGSQNSLGFGLVDTY